MKKIFFFLIFQTLLMSLIYAQDTKKEDSCLAFYYPKDLNLKCPKNINIAASFLYMDVFEEGLSYAMQINNLAGRSKNNINYKPGFRFNIGFDKEKIAMSFVWTYINIKATDTMNSEGGLLGTFLPPNTGNLDHASAKLSGDFNTFDWNFSRPYHVSRKFISTPSLGLRGAYIDQKYKLEYTLLNDIGTVSCKNDLWGIGFKAAYDMRFILGKGFTLYANIASSVLYSKFDISQISQTIIATANYRIKETIERLTPNAEMSLGFSYCFVVRQHLKGTMLLGYEFHQWWAVNHLRRFFNNDPSTTAEVRRNDLTFHGMIFSLIFDL